jgi:hypothetical protein
LQVYRQNGKKSNENEGLAQIWGLIGATRGSRLGPPNAKRLRH